ncbi:MAG: neutral/alkaline non-lysosomal ceramidase N-terminal domain-containing protein [Phycisphaeraceae bacterium]|nr:neutral/alkaline non-lysosomal ceramidase N-terminal domain-containing protein [Phycisphaeraceae bacterium]
MNKQSILRAGVGRADITPALGTALMGYPDPLMQRTATSVRDPLHATALALQQGDETAIILSLDITIIDDSQVLVIREIIENTLGIPGDRVSLCAIQTHSAPRTIRAWGWCEIDEPYVNDVMIPGAVRAAEVAWRSMVPVRVGIAETQSHVGVNRRGIHPNHGVGLGVNPWAAYDPTMTVLRFESARGPLANVVHYGAHPTVLGSWSQVISRDWPGIMIDRMEQLTKATTLYLNGAVGDIAPRTNSMGAVGDVEAALWEAGAAAAMDAMRAWRSIKDLRDLDLAVATSTLMLPHRPLTPMEEAKRELAKAEPNKDTPGQGICDYLHWKSVVEAYSRPVQTSRPYRQVITSLGPVAMVPFPGEPFAETVLRLRHVSPFAHTLALSTSCGCNGYFPSRESLHRGGYETWVGRAFGPYLLSETIDDALVDLNLAELEPLWSKLNPPLAEV